jgi:L-lactate dehydrogenase complex protein LldF
VAGPIGSILNPNLDMKANSDLPFASTLCGSCSNVCPVKIDIHDQLWKWRQVIVANGYVDKGKKAGMQGMAWVLSNPQIYRLSGKIGRWIMRTFTFMLNNSLNVWYKQREMPRAPEKSFRDWFKENK